MMRVCFDVGGHIFTIRKDLIDAGPSSRLTSLCNGVDVIENGQRVIIDRPVDLFQAILALYQTGQLHMPMTSCPGVFLRELEFWDIQPEMLQSCCMYRLQLFLDEQQTLNKFRENVTKGDGKSMLASCMPGLEGIRAKIWAIIDCRENSILAKLYFIIILIMVLLSIFAVAYSTEPSFQRNMTNCERHDFMASAKMEHFELISHVLRAHCDETEIPTPNLTQHSIVGNGGSGSNSFYDYDNEYAFMMYPDYIETDTSLTSTTPLMELKRVKIPDMKVPIFAIVFLEMLTLAFFTVEIAIRLLVCPSILRYFMSVINVVDAAALVGAYIHILIVNINKHEKYKDNWNDMFDYMQMLRSIRLFRILKNLRASRVLLHSFRMNLNNLCIVAVYMLVGVCTFSSCVYLLEDRQTFPSIPVGWYWAMITMTTVGYGDLLPMTPWGKFMACMCAISGVLLFALSVPIFATHFLTLYRYAGLEKTFSATNIAKRFNGGQSSVGGNKPMNQPTGAPVEIPMENFENIVTSKANQT